MAETKRLKKDAKHLIIDAGSPMDFESLDNIIQACQNVFALLCNIHDRSQNTLLSIGTISQQYKTILKPIQTFGSYCKISKALSQTQNEAKMNIKPEEESFNDYLTLGLNLVVQDLKSESMLEMCDEFYDIDVCLITQKDALDIKQFLDCLIKNKLNLHVKRNTVVQVLRSNQEGGKEDLLYYKVNCSKAEIEFHIKKWLLDKRFDREHLRLLLPDDSILCDLKENLIAPNLLSMGHKFYIRQESIIANLSQNLSGDNDVLISGEIISILVEKQCESQILMIQIISRISSSGLCESQVFGEPYDIIPTAFCQNGYEDALSVNAQKFHSLCKSLIQKDEYLIGKLEDELPSGFFVLIPSFNSILIKPLVSRELLIPKDDQIQAVTCSKLISDRIEESLSLVDLLDEYDPNENSSGIYSALQNLYMKSVKKCEEPKEESTNWVKVSHPALENKTGEKPSNKKKRRRVEPLNIIQYIEKLND